MRCALALLCLAAGVGAVDRDDEFQKYAMNFWQDRSPDESRESVGEWLEKGKSFGCVRARFTGPRELASDGAFLHPWPCRCAMCNIMVRTIVERQESAASGELTNGYTEAVRQTA